MRVIFADTFHYLFIALALYSSLIAFGVLPLLVRVELLVVALGVVGYFGFFRNEEKPISLVHLRILFWFAVAVLVISRLYWFFMSSVPPGYDPGWYIAVFDEAWTGQWVKEGFPLLFTTVMWLFSLVFGSHIVMYIGSILLSIAVGFVWYILAKKMWGQEQATFILLIYACSFTMYHTFWMIYMKNLVGLALIPVGFYFLHKNNRLWTILLGIIIGGSHRPALLLFLFGYAYDSLVNIRTMWKQRIIDGLIIAAGVIIINGDRVSVFLLSGASAVADSLTSDVVGGGTFFSFPEYLTYSMIFLPFAVMGVLRYWRSWYALSGAGAIAFIFVIFELFFFRRFIIYLELFVIFFAALGLVLYVRRHVYMVYVFALVLLLVPLFVVPAQEPLISEDEFAYIRSLSLDGVLLSTDSYYSPWLRGYADAEVIAPGLFDNNPWDRASWNAIWFDSQRRIELLQTLDGPVYVYVGERQRQLGLAECFDQLSPRLYEFVC